MVGSTARRRCAPSPAAATPLTGFSSLMSRPPSPPGTGPAPFACLAPMQHGKPDDHDDDPFPVGRGVTAGTRANARPLPSCHPGAPAPYRRGTGPAHPDARRLQGRDDHHWRLARRSRILAAARATAGRAASPTHGSWLIPRPDAHSSPAVSPASPAGLPAGRSASPAWPLLTSLFDLVRGARWMTWSYSRGRILAHRARPPVGQR